MIRLFLFWGVKLLANFSKAIAFNNMVWYNISTKS